MIEDEKVIRNIIEETVLQHEHAPVSALSIQYLGWLLEQNFDTKSFEWLVLNLSLLSAIEEKPIRFVFFRLLHRIQHYSDLSLVIRDPLELEKFNRFIRVVPFKKK